MKTICGFLTNPLCTQTLTQMASEMWPSRGWQECRPGETAVVGWNGVSVSEQSYRQGPTGHPPVRSPGVRGDHPLAVPGTAVSPSTSTRALLSDPIPAGPHTPSTSRCFTLTVTQGVKFPVSADSGVCHRIVCFDFHELKKLRTDSCLQVSYIHLLPYSSRW